MLPRFRIAWVMVAVAIAALDLALIRSSLASWKSAIAALGILPMTHLLAVGILIGRRHPGTCLFLSDFETFGGIALALFVAVSRSPA